MSRFIYLFIFVVIISVILFFVFEVTQSKPAKEWFESSAIDKPRITLPKDDGYHSAKMEWWYYNGHLVTETGRAFSFHFTTFLVNNLMTHTVFHSSVSDQQHGKHYIEQLRVGGNSFARSKNSFEFRQGNWLLIGKNGQDKIKVGNDKFAFDLQLKSTQPVVYHGDNGLIPVNDVTTSYYYSRTRMKISGTLEVNNITENVKGIAWFDHQWGNFSTVNIAWDWFSLQLDNGADLMLYQIRDKTGKPIHYMGSITEQGKTELLENKDFSIIPGKKWQSKKTGIDYPMNWNIKIAKKNINLDLKSIVNNSEFDARLTTYNVYWEGPIHIEGSHTGKGFMELSGYSAKHN